MSYNGSSQKYSIPIATDGERLLQENNIEQMNIIDYLLQASVAIVNNGVIAEGEYYKLDNVGSGYSILLNPVDGISMEAVLRDGLVQSSSSVQWTGLSTGNFYYLYIKFTNGLYKDPEAFETYSSTTPVDATNQNYILIATYDLTGGYPGDLNTDPTGKLYVIGMAAHVRTTEDPHSTTWTQTNLIVTDSMEVGLDVSETVDVYSLFSSSSSSASPLITLSHANSSISLIKSQGEFVFEDTRTSTQLSEVSIIFGSSSSSSSSFAETYFINGKDSIVGAINKNTTDIGTNTSAISLNTTHRTSDGTNHSDVVSNNTHRGSVGTDHSDVVSNNTHRGSVGTDHSDVVSNNAHRINTNNPHNVTASQSASSDDWSPPPTGTVVGEMKYDTTTGQSYWWDGVQWVDGHGLPYGFSSSSSSSSSYIIPESSSSSSSSQFVPPESSSSSSSSEQPAPPESSSSSSSSPIIPPESSSSSSSSSSSQFIPPESSSSSSSSQIIPPEPSSSSSSSSSSEIIPESSSSSSSPIIPPTPSSSSSSSSIATLETELVLLLEPDYDPDPELDLLLQPEASSSSSSEIITGSSSSSSSSSS